MCGEQGGAFALLVIGCGKSTRLNIYFLAVKTVQRRKCFCLMVNASTNWNEERNIAQVFRFPWCYRTWQYLNNLAFRYETSACQNTRWSPKSTKSRKYQLSDQLKRKQQAYRPDAEQSIYGCGFGFATIVSAILFDEPLRLSILQWTWKLRRSFKQIMEQFNSHGVCDSRFSSKLLLLPIKSRWCKRKMSRFGTPRELFENPAHTFVWVTLIGMSRHELLVRRVNEHADFWRHEIATARHAYAFKSHECQQ